MLTGVKVLLVENEPDTLAITQAILVLYEARVVAVEVAIEGLEQLSVQLPDVIVSNIGMLEMDGYQFIREVRKTPARERRTNPSHSPHRVSSSRGSLKGDRRRFPAASFQASRNADIY